MAKACVDLCHQCLWGTGGFGEFGDVPEKGTGFLVWVMVLISGSVSWAVRADIVISVTVTKTITSHLSGTTSERWGYESWGVRSWGTAPEEMSLEGWGHGEQRLKRWVLRRLWKMASDGADVMCCGRPFQIRGATVGKVASPTVNSHVQRTVCVCVCPFDCSITHERIYGCRPTLVGFGRGYASRTDQTLVFLQFWMWSRITFSACEIGQSRQFETFLIQWLANIH